MSRQANLYFRTEAEALAAYEQIITDPYESAYPPRKVSHDCWVIVRSIYTVRD
jgi:hypothetical protein